MAFVWKDSRSPYFTACWYDREGKLHRKTTKCADKRKAQGIAYEFESAERLAKRLSKNRTAVCRAADDIKFRILGESAKVPSIKDWFATWLKEKSRSLAAGTSVRYQESIKAFLRFLGPTKATHRLDELAIADISNFREKRLKDGARAKTFNTDLKIISSALRKAQKLALITTNPAEALDALPLTDSTTREAFTDAQIQKLLQAVDYDNDWKGAVLLGLWTGQRMGDILNLRWEMVDMNKDIITFKPQKTIRQNKTVTIPIMPDLKKWLSEQPAPFDKHQKVLAGFGNKGVGGQHGLSCEFTRILARVGLQGESFQPKSNMRRISSLSFHSLRHTFTSRMANNGVPAEIRMLLTGHSSLKVHEGYTHFDVEHLREVLAKIPSVA